MICPNCGSGNPEESVFCNKCGVKLNELNTNNTDKDIIGSETSAEHGSIRKDNIIKKINTKVKVILGVFLSLIIIMSVGYLVIKPPSSKKVFEKVKFYETEEAISYLNKVYPDDGGFLGLFKKKNKDNKVEVLSLMITNIADEFKNTHGRSIADYNAVKISKVEIKHKSYGSDYVDIDVTIENGSQTAISYIKINLYFKDKNGKIIRSDWTNDSSVIQPGASQVVTEMTENDGWYSVAAEISDIR